MAAYHMIELNNAHCWLPPEILQDIGVAKADDPDLTIIEELASHLVGVLNSTMERHKHCHLHHVRANNCYRHQGPPQPQTYRLDRQVHITNGSANAKTMKTWPLLGSDRIMHRAINLPRLALAKQQLVGTALLPGKQSRGTGVFLPRTDTCNQMTRQAKTPRTSSADLNPHYNRKQCQQKQQQKLRILANVSGATNELHERKTKEANAASHDCLDELGLPHEWLY
ncbi:hypothetical protein BS78_01G353400 [Paspalum vaginatum]|nr:hypothetical protein BS78_01G353400 [Paspalum vaginatum]